MQGACWYIYVSMYQHTMQVTVKEGMEWEDHERSELIVEVDIASNSAMSSLRSCACGSSSSESTSV